MNLLAAVILFIVFSASSQHLALAEEDSPVVQTSFGPVQGLTFVSPWTKKTIYAFRGIPYAAPPLGDLRFKDPVPPEKWSTVKNCTEDGNACPQVNFFGDDISNTDEDCLYINVYTPQVKPVGGLLPVMAWVHGGGFFAGSGGYNETGPDFLVAEDVVVVTFNYRLGALGFLSLDIPEAPGNAGMKDQLLALQWVQREIQQFGGNADNVTLFGESAGSASVHLHYLSPLSKGLFHRVIGESGTALTDWSVRTNAAMYGKQMAVVLNCSTTNPAVILKCLYTANAQAIVYNQQRLILEEEDVISGLPLIFVPSIDKASKNPFIPDYPRRLLEQGKGSSVPFIMGTNSDEGMMSLNKDEEQIKNITNNLEQFIPQLVRNQSTESRLAFLVKKIRQFYFQDSEPSYSNLRGYVDLYTDVMFGYSTAVSARLFKDRADVYLYIFSFNGAFKERFAELLIQKYNFSGVCHAEELSYLFVRQKVNQTTTEDSPEMKTWLKMTKLWTNFAKYGTPTVGTDPQLDFVTWLPVGNMTNRYLSINRSLTMVSNDYLGPRVALWDSMTPSRSGYLQATAVLVVLLTAIILYLTK